MAETGQKIDRGAEGWYKLLVKVPALRTVALVFMSQEERVKLAEVMVAQQEAKVKKDLSS